MISGIFFCVFGTCTDQIFFVPLHPFSHIMITNSHILTINDRVSTARHLIRQMPDSLDRQMLLVLLDDVSDRLFSLNNDIRQDKARIEELSKMIYAPEVSAQLTYPDEDDYSGVREYVDSRKARDPVFKDYCKCHTRTELCERLSDEFGWYVNPKSYGRNLQRH